MQLKKRKDNYITFSKMLILMESVFWAWFTVKYTSWGEVMFFEWRGKKAKYIFTRKLINENNIEATLLEQSEETQYEIALLLWWKDE